MNKQTGSALIISLLILLVMTMLGIASMSTSTLEEKMAANDRNQKVAFENAELTLDDAETIVIDSDWMEDLNTKILSDNNDGYYGLGEKASYYDKATWKTEPADAATCLAVANNQNGSKACYIVEHVGDQMPLEAGGGYGQLNQSNMAYKILKVSANSTDSNGASSSIVQSTTRKAYIPHP